MDFDFKSLLRTVAPGIATALGGPLAGLAVNALGDALGLSQPTQEKIQAALAGATPEDMLKVKLAEQDFQKTMRQLDIDLEKVAAADRSSAREREGKVGGLTTPVLAWTTIAAFLAMTAGVLFGKVEVDGVLAGTVIGYIFANAQQIYAYYFGSSASSSHKTDLLARADATK